MLNSPAGRASHSSSTPRTSAAFSGGPGGYPSCAPPTHGMSSMIPIARIRNAPLIHTSTAPGTDKPDMNFWLTLPEIRCQACLSPSARSGGPMCEVLFRPRHPRASLHPLLKIRRVFLGAHRVEWREAKRERGQFRHLVWRIHRRHRQRPAHQRHRIRCLLYTSDAADDLTRVDLG